MVQQVRMMLEYGLAAGAAHTLLPIHRREEAVDAPPALASQLIAESCQLSLDKGNIQRL